MESMVYINYGRVVFDCPGECGNAYRYEYGATSQSCNGPDGCGVEVSLLVPNNLAELFQELAKRPVTKTRNWYPEGHPLAVRGNLPMGQTTSDLSAEFELGREGKLD